MDINFQEAFLSTDFDSILNNAGNDHVNNEVLYISCKQRYYQQSLYTLGKFEDLQKQVNDIRQQKYQKDLSGKRIIYMYSNEKKEKELLDELTALLLQQRKLFSNFQHYVNMLNSDTYLLTENKTTTPLTKRSSIRSRRSTK